VGDQDLGRFSAELLAFEAQFYPQRKLSPEAVMGYFSALREYELDSVLLALMRYVRMPEKCAFFPMPGHLIEILGADAKTRALRAWAEVVQAMRTRGRYRSVQFTDAGAAAVVLSFGGWPRLCDVHSDRELDDVRAEFLRRFDSHSRGLESNAPRVVLGLVDLDRIGRGMEPLPAVCMGSGRVMLSTVSGDKSLPFDGKTGLDR
jgi:hypothetical protein